MVVGGIGLNLDSPRTLLVETSTRLGLVALAEGSKILGFRQLEEARRHARDLAPAVWEMLQEQGWKPQDIQVVIVSKGPGSYTGLRVGIMSAKTIAYATGCRLLGMDTFAAIAWQAPLEAQKIDVFADAQQDRVYFQRFSRKAGELNWTSETTLRICPFSTWLNDTQRANWVSGPGLTGKEDRLPSGVRIVEANLWHVQAESLLKLGLVRYRNGEQDDVLSLEPLYLRASAAEEQWAERFPETGK